MNEEMIRGPDGCYRMGNQKYPSVTTITKQISKFKSGRPGPAAAIGSLAHYHILKRYKTGKPLDLPPDMVWRVDPAEVQAKIMAARKMWRDLNLNLEIKEVERLVINSDYMYAGRLDINGIDENNLVAVADIKTGAIYSPEYEMQIAAYAKCIGAEIGYIVQLDLNADRNPDQIGKLHIIDDIDKHFDKFLELVYLYWELKDG